MHHFEIVAASLQRISGFQGHRTFAAFISRRFDSLQTPRPLDDDRRTTYMKTNCQSTLADKNVEACRGSLPTRERRLVMATSSPNSGLEQGDNLSRFGSLVGIMDSPRPWPALWLPLHLSDSVPTTS